MAGLRLWFARGGVVVLALVAWFVVEERDQAGTVALFDENLRRGAYMPASAIAELERAVGFEVWLPARLERFGYRLVAVSSHDLPEPDRTVVRTAFLFYLHSDGRSRASVFQTESTSHPPPDSQPIRDAIPGALVWHLPAGEEDFWWLVVGGHQVVLGFTGTGKLSESEVLSVLRSMIPRP